MNRARLSVFIISAMGAAFSVAAQAEYAAPAKLKNRFALDIGAYAPAIGTALRVDGTGGRGVEFSLEDDMDFDDRVVTPYALANFRLGERWRLEGEYIPLDRENSLMLERDIVIGDITFPISTQVTGFFDTDTYRLSLGYAFLKTPATELGATLGAHVTTFDLGVRSSGGRSAYTDTLAPLPTLGAYGMHAFSSKWLLSGRADYFALDYDKYSGAMLDLNIAVEYQLFENLGLGIGYRYIDLDLDVDEDVRAGAASFDFTGHFDYQYSGPTLFMSLSF
jgi:hypothetical protein